ncbi:MAG: zinc ribbon domain-containing protein [Planctomycetota bacterium]|jgi:cell division protein FtsB
MMESRRPDFDELVSDVSRRERRARRFATLYSLVPVLLAVAFLWYTAHRVSVLNDEVAWLDGQKTEYKTQVATLSLEASDLTARVEDLEGQKTSLTEEKVAFEREIARLEDRSVELEGRNDAMELALDKSTQELEAARSSAAELERRATERQQEVERLQQTVARLESQIRDASSLVKFFHRIDLPELKGMQFGPDQRAGEILLRIHELDQRGVGWSAKEQSERVGFNSPSFASHVLRSIGLHVSVQDLEVVDEPRPGDLLVYPSGYYMFYFLDSDREPYVVGMTPFGIASLKIDFAEPRRILRLPD